MTQPQNYTDAECLDAIRRATEEIGHPPTKAEYQATDVEPSVETISEVLGMEFHEAREEAGVEAPGQADGRTVELHRNYFASIETSEQAYWLGTLWGHSSRVTSGDSNHLTVSHTVKERHFVEGFHEAIGAGYKIGRYEYDGNQPRLQFDITDRTFVEHLDELGLTDSARNVDTMPEISEDLRPHFVRGFLETRARLAGGSITLTSSHREKLETLAEWIEAFGIERSHIGEQQSGRYSFRIGSVFDVAVVFETCWVDVDPSIRWTEFYEAGKRDICEEHPYPENLSFCRTQPSDGDSETASEVATGNADGSEHPTPTDDEDSPRTDDFKMSVSLPPSLVLASRERSRDDTSRGGDTGPGVRDHLITFTRDLVSAPYPKDVANAWPSPTVPDLIEVTIDLPAPTKVALEAIVNDSASPFETIDEYAVVAVARELETGGTEHNLTVRPETAALLEEIGDGEASTGAAVLLEETIRRELGEE